MGWDETPRSQRGGDNDDLEVNGKEWEEEQVRLDRDWYSHDDEGAVVSEQWSSACSEESGVLTLAA
jgi:pre-mRNA-splicing factor ATP-dependent RNA helicase DHX38/PRP16